MYVLIITMFWAKSLAIVSIPNFKTVQDCQTAGETYLKENKNKGPAIFKDYSAYGGSFSCVYQPK